MNTMFIEEILQQLTQCNSEIATINDRIYTVRWHKKKGSMFYMHNRNAWERDGHIAKRALNIQTIRYHRLLQSLNENSGKEHHTLVMEDEERMEGV